MYKIFIAFRYLIARPISLVSIIGIMLSVGALIVVVAVMSGFLKETKAIIRGTMADIVITPHQYYQKVDEKIEFLGYPPWEILEKTIEKVPGVLSISPRFNRGALIRRSDGGDPFISSSKLSKINAAFVLGIDFEKEKRTTQFGQALENIEVSSHSVSNLEDPFFLPQNKKRARYFSCDFPSILLGETKFNQLHLRCGDVVTLATLDEVSLADGQDVKAFEKKFFVSGAFRTGHQDFDMQHAIVSIDAARDWIGVEDEISEIYVAVEDYGSKGIMIADALREAFSSAKVPASVETWEERNSVFLGAVENERTILGVILAFFILIATFNVYATISMMVTDKTKDIGILVSLGATSFGVMGTFVICGLFMWLIGSALGAVGGYLFANNINDIKDFIERLFGIQVFRDDIYNFSEIPVELSVSFVGLIIVVTFFMCLFFSIIPALRASWMHPVKALRHE